jgi:hypothetical protein
MFPIIDTLNSVFTFIATGYVYFMAIALLLLIVQEAIASQSPVITDDFYQQTKELFAEPEPKELAVAIAKHGRSPIAVVPAIQTPSRPTGKALVITVKEESDFSKMGWKSIRSYIKKHQLQGIIRSALGKSVSECRLEELRRALEDYVADRQCELV